MYTLLVKEINSFFSSLTGYIVLVVFLLINSLFLWVFSTDFNITSMGYASIDGLFVLAPFVFLFLIPAITMRSFADENKAGTIELLLTKPLTDLQLILSKYFAGLLLVFFALLPTLVYYLSVIWLGYPPGNIDHGAVWGSYIGLLMLGAVFVSIGVFCSVVTDKQVLAFVLAVFLCGFMYIGFEFIYSLDLFGKVDLFIQSLGINAHYVSMSRGVIDTRDLVYFLSLIIFFILLSKITLEKRKW